MLDELVSPSYVAHPGMGTCDGFRQRSMALHAVFSEPDFVIEDMIAEGDKVMFRWTDSAVQTGSCLGLPPSGKRISYQGMTAFRIEHGKIVEDWYAIDHLIYMKQLGITPNMDHVAEPGWE